MGSNKNNPNIFVKGEIKDFKKWSIYHINPLLLNYIFAHLRFKSNTTGHYLSEYDFQYEIWQYLQNLYKNTNGVVKRESRGKVDIIVEKKLNGKMHPKVYYELKTFIKPHEKKLKPHDIAKDIQKLAMILLKEKENMAFFILIARTKVLIEKIDFAKKDTINKKMEDLFKKILEYCKPIYIKREPPQGILKKQYPFDFVICREHKDYKKINAKIIVRPSVKKIDKEYAVLFFEIKLKRG